MYFKRDNELVERVKTNHNEDKDVLKLVRLYESTTYPEWRDKAKFTADAVESFTNDFGFADDEIAEKMASSHRTLQQSFMGLCLKFIKLMSEKTYYDARNESSVKKAKKIMEAIENETHLPFV